MDKIKSHKDLKIWQKGIVIVKEIYLMCQSLPKEELYALQSQLKRSAVSIPSNIAEGYGRHYTKNYIQFLNIARGSLLELETQVTIGRELDFITKEIFEKNIELITEESKMINAFIKSIERHI
ncbi:MAG: four helix bundle protein [Crocinitomicaceae bacterium]